LGLRNIKLRRLHLNKSLGRKEGPLERVSASMTGVAHHALGLLRVLLHLLENIRATHLNQVQKKAFKLAFVHLLNIL